jgi:predicted enzyme related to lactoylglutathione lyase
MAIHNIVHVEISAKEPKALSKFYADVFGWEIKHLDEMGYTTFATGEGVGGGFNPVTDQNPTGTFPIYIQTDDVTASLKDVVKAGGMIISPEMEIPNTGKFGLFRDPQENLIGLFNPFPMA